MTPKDYTDQQILDKIKLLMRWFVKNANFGSTPQYQETVNKLNRLMTQYHNRKLTLPKGTHAWLRQMIQEQYDPR